MVAADVLDLPSGAPEFLAGVVFGCLWHAVEQQRTAPVKRRPRGVPAARARGVAIRALLAAMVKPGKPVPLHEVAAVLGMDRVAMCQHLCRMRDDGRITGYSTAEGKVRVW